MSLTPGFSRVQLKYFMASRFNGLSETFKRFRYLLLKTDIIK